MVKTTSVLIALLILALLVTGILVFLRNKGRIESLTPKLIATWLLTLFLGFLVLLLSASVVYV